METVTKKNISKYIRLSKLRIVELLLITTVPSMIVSIYGFPPLELIVFTLLGGTLLAVSANVLNQIFEIETDRLMERTAKRPLVTGFDISKAKKELNFNPVDFLAGIEIMDRQLKTQNEY